MAISSIGGVAGFSDMELAELAIADAVIDEQDLRAGRRRKQAYRAANPGSEAESQRRYREANKGKIAARNKKYNEAHKEQIAIKRRQRYKASRERLRADIRDGAREDGCAQTSKKEAAT